MIKTATIHLKGSGTITVCGCASMDTTEDQLFVEIHSHDVITGKCRDTYIPMSAIIMMSVE